MEKLEVYPVITETTSSLKSYNFYVVYDGTHLFLIDAGVDSDESWTAFNKVLTENKFTIKDLDFILLTHHHIDHIGLIKRILAYKELPIYAHERAFKQLKRDEDSLSKRVNFFERLYKEMDCGTSGDERIEQMKKAIIDNKDQAIKADFRQLQAGDSISHLTVMNAQGHASDHIAFYEKEEGLLFSGDNVFGHMNSNALLERDEDDTLYPSLDSYVDTLEGFQALNLKTIYPGHGELIRNPHDVIASRLKAIHIKSERILNLVREAGRVTASQVAKAYYKKVYEKMFQFVISEAVGHLNRLEKLGELESVLYNDVRYYYVP